MIKLFYKSLSLLLAFLVLGSTMSFKISKHYCGEHLVDVAFFGEAVPCAMEQALTIKYGEEHTKKIYCCVDEDTFISGQDELKVQLQHSTQNTVAFLQAVTHGDLHYFGDAYRQKPSLVGKPPPLLTLDLQLLYEQYLI